MAGMSREQMNQILAGPHIARIGTINTDGSPHVTPAWYDWDGQSVFLVGRKKSEWVDHIRRDSRVTVLIDEVAPLEFKIVMKGTGTIASVDWVEIARRMTIRYFGNETGLSYLQESLDQPRYVVKITPTKITTWFVTADKAAGRYGWHPRYYDPDSKWYAEYKAEISKKRKF